MRRLCGLALRAPRGPRRPELSDPLANPRIPAARLPPARAGGGLKDVGELRELSEEGVGLARHALPTLVVVANVAERGLVKGAQALEVDVGVEPDPEVELVPNHLSQKLTVSVFDFDGRASEPDPMGYAEIQLGALIDGEQQVTSDRRSS